MQELGINVSTQPFEEYLGKDIEEEFVIVCINCDYYIPLEAWKKCNPKCQRIYLVTHVLDEYITAAHSTLLDMEAAEITTRPKSVKMRIPHNDEVYEHSYDYLGNHDVVQAHNGLWVVQDAPMTNGLSLRIYNRSEGMGEETEDDDGGK